MKVIYHMSDLDGKCSAAIVRKAYPRSRMMPYNHGHDFPWEAIEEGEPVFLLDLTLDLKDMLRLDKTAELIWIDHHAPRIAEIEAAGLNPAGLRDPARAACELCWEYLFWNEDVPDAVSLIGRNDTSRFDNDPCIKDRARCLHYAVEAERNHPESEIWPELFRAGKLGIADPIMMRGETIWYYVQKQSAVFAKNYSFDTSIDGHRAVALNHPPSGSPPFEAVYDPEQHDVMVAFARTRAPKGTVWRVSVYSDKEDVDANAIAKKFGGGGHRFAASFLCDDLPFEV